MNLIDEWQSIKIAINRIHKFDNNTKIKLSKFLIELLNCLTFYSFTFYIEFKKEQNAN